jgi:hypothetical protein
VHGASGAYPKDSNCNAIGLTDLGDHAVRGLLQRKMIVDPDHLSVRARKSVMDLLEAARYSGAVSSHSWSTADVIPRIYKLGGVITPMKESAEEWIKTWRMTKAQRDQRFYFGFGYGSDQNGLSSQPAPPRGPQRGRVPVQVVRRARDLPAPAQRPSRVRHHQGRRGPLRAVPGLVGGHPPRWRRRRREGHVARSGGLPPGVGA